MQMLKLVRNINGVQLKIFAIFRPLQLYSTSTTPANDDVASVASFLVQNLGFTHPQSLSTSSKFSHIRRCAGSKQVSYSRFASNANSVIQLFNDYGFNQTQIRVLVDFDPRVLTASVDKTLKPKLKFFEDEGFSKANVVELFCENPIILTSGLNSRVSPAIRALKQILIRDDDVVLFFKKLRKWILFSSVSQYLVKNVALLQSYGIPIEAIRKRLLSHPNPFLNNSKLFEEIVVRVEQKLGIPRNSGLFLYGIQMLSANSDMTIESKLKVFESFGWLKSDVSALCRRCPLCLGFSESLIKRKLDYLVHELGLTPAYIASNFIFLTFSLEKRVMPRHKILSLLKERGLIKANSSLYEAIRLSDSGFVHKFVLPFNEVHQVYTDLTGVALDKLDDDVAMC